MALTDFFQNLGKNFLSRSEESVLGIDIGSSSIKAVQLKNKKGRVLLETYGEIALGPYTDVEVGLATSLNAEQISNAIKDLIKEANITTVDSGIAIPMKQSMVTNFTVPFDNRKQMQQMVPIEARKYIPVPITEVTLDWFPIPKSQSDLRRADFEPGEIKSTKEEEEGQGRESTDVLAVAIHNNVLNEYNKIVQSSELATTFFEVEMFSTVRSVLDVDQPNPVMVFDMGASQTKLYITERGIIHDSHMINKGAQELTLNLARALNISVDFAEGIKRKYGRNDKEQDAQLTQIADLVLNPIFTEANRFMLNYEKASNKVVAKVVFVGGGVQLNGFIDRAKKFLSTDLELGDPFGKVVAPAFLQDILQQTGPGFATAIGLALRKIQELG